MSQSYLEEIHFPILKFELQQLVLIMFACLNAMICHVIDKLNI